MNFFTSVSVLLTAFVFSLVAQDNRAVLVIGNAGYQREAGRADSVNDVAHALASIGWKVAKSLESKPVAQTPVQTTSDLGKDYSVDIRGQDYIRDTKAVHPGNRVGVEVSLVLEHTVWFGTRTMPGAAP